MFYFPASFFFLFHFVFFFQSDNVQASPIDAAEKLRLDLEKLEAQKAKKARQLEAIEQQRLEADSKKDDKMFSHVSFFFCYLDFFFVFKVFLFIQEEEDFFKAMYDGMTDLNEAIQVLTDQLEKVLEMKTQLEETLKKHYQRPVFSHCFFL